MKPTESNLSAGEYLVGAAVSSFVPGSCTLFTAQIFGGLVEEQLRRDGNEIISCAPFFGSAFVAVVVTVPRLHEALRSISDTLSAFKPFAQYHRELAFFDISEGYWRTVYPLPAHMTFARFVSDEVMLENRQQCRLHSQFLETLRLFAEAKLKDSGHPDNSHDGPQ